jgi:predicted nuclease of predicted toxin-antitoxin system
MIVWVDAQLPPALAGWLREHGGVDAHALRDFGLRDAEDRNIFAAARDIGCVLITADIDFVDVLTQHGPPPQVAWVACGNSANELLLKNFTLHSSDASTLIGSGEPLVELGGKF